MEQVVTAKFTYNPQLAAKLFAATGYLLVDGQHLARPNLEVVHL